MPVLENGFELINDLLSEEEVQYFRKEYSFVNFPSKVGGIRNAEKKFSSIGALALSERLLCKVGCYLNGTPKLVRAILFNKTEESNWLVTWHQDKTVAVSKRFEQSGWGPWSVKDNTDHVQPPLSVLNQMVSIRIHLDDASIDNGCLKIFPKSHDLGLLEQSEIQQYVIDNSPVSCEAKAGSALVMRPHILHSSSKAVNPSQRRVIHLEYSNYELPQGVTWA